MKTKFYTSKSCILFLLLIAVSLPVSAQDILEFDWARSLGGTENDESYSIAVDDSGYVYSTGFFNATADFNPGEEEFSMSSNGGRDIFISKLDSAGNFVWAKSFGGTDDDESYSITLDNESNVYITGSFLGTVDFDPGAETFELTAYGKDIFVVKLTPYGEFVWAINIGGENSVNLTNVGVLKSLQVDNDQNVYITGSFLDTLDFNPDLNAEEIIGSAGDFDIYIAKLNAQGALSWVKTIGSEGKDESNFLAIDNSALYITGSFIDSLDFDPSEEEAVLIANGGQDMFVAKLDTAGNFEWAKNMGGGNVNVSLGIAVNKEATAGNIYITGYFIGATDFDPGDETYELSVTGDGGIDMFVCKLDQFGDFVWAKNFGSPANDLGTYIVANDNEEIFLTGYLGGTVTFDPEFGIEDMVSVGGLDAYIMILNSSGEVTFARSVGGPAGDFGSSIATDASGNVYTTGSYSGSADFNTGEGEYMLTEEGEGDIFVHKLKVPCFVDTSVFSEGTELTAVLSGASYQWLNCDNANGIIDGATSQTYTATANGNYAVVLTMGACSDTSACINVSSVGIAELTNENIATVFPNPATNKVTIKAKSSFVNAKLQLMDISGKNIETKVFLNGNTVDLDLGNYASGVYFIRIWNEDKTSTMKLLKH